jgi:DNA-binding LacI/PurR family transcriptional regulator
LGAVLATRHLVSLGHRNIVFLGGNASHPSLAARQSGYQQVIEKEGLRPCSIIHETGAQEDMERLERLKAHSEFGQWFVREVYLKEHPTAIFCYDDGYALMMLRAFYQAGISVPRDVSVIGFNDMPFVDSMPVSLTTMRSDFYSMGCLAGELLFKIMEDPSHPLPSVILKPTLIVRESTAQPRSK